MDNYRERLHQCISIQGRHLSDVLFKTRWCKTAFWVLSRNKKTFAVSSLVLNLLASQIGDFFLPHPVDLRFSLVLLRKASAVEEETKWAAWLYHRCNQSIHLTEGVTVMSHSASVLQKISMHMNHLCEIASNRKLLH